MIVKTDVFRAGEGFPCYRIPGLVVTARGTLLAYCETRLSGDDWDAHGVCVKRSADGGKTWTDHQVVPMRDCTVNNPVMIAAKNGAVHLFWQTDYKDLFHQISSDDGATFSAPERVTVLEDYRAEYDWTCAAIGPGHGVETNDGALILPVWLARGEGRKHFPSVVSSIRSTDGGKTFARGEIVYGAPEQGFDSPNETNAALLPDGTIYYSFRHRGASDTRFHAISTDGLRFSPLENDAALPDPRCFGSLCSRGDKMYFSNCAVGGRKRMFLTARESADGGKTWSKEKLIEAGEAGYSDLAVGADGKLYCLYERGHAERDAGIPAALTLAAFDESDLMNPQAALKELAYAARDYAARELEKAGIALTADEKTRIEVADMGLGRLAQTGLELITYVNTERCCAKELVLLPGQTCPEHTHPTIGGAPGKEETFRCRAGIVYLYVSGEKTEHPAVFPPEIDKAHYTAAHEVILRPGEQFTIRPDTPHWFQGGAEGAIVSEFSTSSHDETDIFIHPDIRRTPLLS